MSAHQQKIRLDQLLADRNLAPSRSRARDMISRGHVCVDGKTISKPGQLVLPSVELENQDPAAKYVSRAALKLIAGLDAANITVAGKNALDLGASTGGFTQVLLERDVRHVTAIDVGHDQMDGPIRTNAKVACLEGFNARDLTIDDLPEPPELIVSDVSFISLTLAAEPALLLANKSCECVLLVKPQFEVGRSGIGKGGLVRDQKLLNETNDSIQSWFSSLPGWQLTHFFPSPIEGSDGNKEFLLCGRRS